MKKEENLPLLGLERITAHPELTSYMDENIAVIEKLSDFVESDIEAIKTACLFIVFCEEGSLPLHINDEQHLLHKDYCAILPPGSIFRKTNFKKPYTLKIAAISQSFINTFLGSTKETWDIMEYLFKNPIFPAKKGSSYKMYLYKELLLQLIKEKQHAYSKQTRRFHFAGLLCEMMAEINKILPDEHRKDIIYNRGNTLTRDFILLVNADNGSHRSVSYYANQLCYTPKYLSSIIKQTTGKNPLQIINEHAIKQIKYQLKHSDRSIKEMADYFDFPNPSFFGKFVKTHTGMSPLQYRLSKEKEEM